MDNAATIDRVTKELINKGKIIEAGWASMRMMAIPANASEAQLHEMRNAFFAGAQHLFASIMTTLDGGEEATDADMRRMDSIATELQEFLQQHINKNLKTAGNA